jgi:type IV pilus assembly protein PilW
VRIVYARGRQLGLTLIELMVSITIGLVVVGAVTYLYIGSRGAYRGNEALARMQDAGRFALDSITRDIRRAGALGCGSFESVAGQGAAVNVNVLATGTGLTVGAGGQPVPIQGFEPSAYQPLPLPTSAAPSGWTAPTGTGAPTYWGGDVLQLQIATGVPVRVTAEDTTAATITIANNTVPNGSGAYFQGNNYAVLGNCSAAAIFQVSGTPSAGASAVLSYASSPVPLTTAGQFSLAADTYPTVQHYDQVTYFLGQAPNGLPALYRYSLSSGNPPEELVENIEDMDVVYGIGANGAITTYKKANSPMTAADFANVISVRVSLIAVGDQQGVAPVAQKLMFHGADASPLTPVAQGGASDTKLRQVFNATAALRDRLQ